ncbi:MAG: hypothetical protein ACJAWN_002585 [Neolewinella sp.]
MFGLGHKDNGFNDAGEAMLFLSVHNKLYFLIGLSACSLKMIKFRDTPCGYPYKTKGIGL